ncbi:MAG TPA: hypothetical protein VG937_29115 [Polyangiaceae bacterium]|nr:hypothetical protein [Polyangiaceae bacterium]
MPPRDGQLPLESLRDLIGVARALYAAWKKERVGPIELEELAAVGRDLSAALQLARKTSPGTLGHRAAWSRAEDAARRLGHLVGKLEPLHRTLAAATERALASQSGGATGLTLAERDAKKHHNRMRS